MGDRSPIPRTLGTLAFALVLTGGSAVAIAQGSNGQGGPGRHPVNLPTNLAAKGPQPAPSPEAVAAAQRRADAEARGERIPMPVWDPMTGDMMRHTDGSLVMDTERVHPPPPEPPCTTSASGCRAWLPNGQPFNGGPPLCVAEGRCKS